MWQAIKSTFGSVWGWLGLFVGALSLINLGVTYFSVGIDPILTGIVGTYRAIFHTAFDFLFFWVPMIWPDFSFPLWMKDLTSLYLVLSLAFVRGRRIFYIPYRVSKSFLEMVLFVLKDILFWPARMAELYDRKVTMLFDRESQKMLSTSKHSTYSSVRRTIYLNLAAVPLTAFIFVTISSGMGG